MIDNVTFSHLPVLTMCISAICIKGAHAVFLRAVYRDGVASQ